MADFSFLSVVNPYYKGLKGEFASFFNGIFGLEKNVPIPIQNPLKLFSNHILKTDQSGFGTIKYRNGSQIDVKPSSFIEVSHNFLRVKVGEATFNFTRRNKQFRIQLPNAIIGIYGTKFNVHVKKDQSSIIEMLEGSIKVSHRNGTVTIKAGKVVDIDSSGNIQIRKALLQIPLHHMIKPVKTAGNIKKENSSVTGSDNETEQVVENIPSPKMQIKTVQSVIGDINRDGKINSFDCSLLNNHLNVPVLNKQQLSCADVNNDGAVTKDDLIQFQSYLQYKIDFTGDGIIDKADMDALKPPFPVYCNDEILMPKSANRSF